jgi:hypothetical protein
MSIPQVNSGNFQITETHQANPANADSRFSMAELLESVVLESTVTKTEDCYALGIDAGKQYLEAHFKLGNTYLEQSNYTSAIRCFEAIPNSSDLYAEAQACLQLARMKLTQ